MGMYDESWCSGCGRSITYTEEEGAQCGDCVDIDFHEFRKGQFVKANMLIEYMNLHLISLNQDKDETILSVGDDSIDWHFITGQIEATKHLMSVANDILLSTNERI